MIVQTTKKPQSPLSGLFRQVAEGHLGEAERQIEIAEEEVRRTIRGEGPSGYYKQDTDPVTILIEAATQLELCKVVIKLDDESRGLDPWEDKNGS